MFGAKFEEKIHEGYKKPFLSNFQNTKFGNMLLGQNF